MMRACGRRGGLLRRTSVDAQVEVLRRGGAIGDLHVVFGAQREESLDASAGMLGALALKSVRKE